MPPIAVRMHWKACCPWRKATTYSVIGPSVSAPVAAATAITA